MNISQLDIDAAIEELLAQTPKAEYPEDHKAAMRVPKGGSSCSSCEYLADNKTDCKNEYFQKWNGSAVIPAPIDEYCSDWYEETKDEPAMIEAGGPGSGCNPEVGKCGRPRVKFTDWGHGRGATRGLLFGWHSDSGLGGAGNSEGDGMYIARMPETAKFFGNPNKIYFSQPKNALDVNEEPLHILQETDELMQPIKSTDSEWTKLNKQAVTNAGVTDTSWDSEKVGHALTKLMLDAGYDAVKVTSGGEQWIVMLDKSLIKHPKQLEAGGPGSGCNPEVGKCGRPAGEGEESEADTEREKGLSELQAISDWQAGSHLIRAAAKDILSGQKSDVAYDADAAKDAAILLDEIRNAPVYKGAIYRGLVAYKDNPVLNLKPGDEFQLPLDSFSANLGVAHGFSYGTIPNEQETHVVFQVDDAKGFDLSRAAGDAVYKEVEIVTNGRFKVDKVEDVKSFGPDKFHMVHLQQLGVL